MCLFHKRGERRCVYLINHGSPTMFLVEDIVGDPCINIANVVAPISSRGVDGMWTATALGLLVNSWVRLLMLS